MTNINAVLRLHGDAAVEHAERSGLSLSKLTDPSVIYCDVPLDEWHGCVSTMDGIHHEVRVVSHDDGSASVYRQDVAGWSPIHLDAQWLNVTMLALEAALADRTALLRIGGGEVIRNETDAKLWEVKHDRPVVVWRGAWPIRSKPEPEPATPAPPPRSLLEQIQDEVGGRIVVTGGGIQALCSFGDRTSWEWPHWMVTLDGEDLVHIGVHRFGYFGEGAETDLAHWKDDEQPLLTFVEKTKEEAVAIVRDLRRGKQAMLVERLAAEFRRVLHKWLGERICRKVDEQNASSGADTVDRHQVSQNTSTSAYGGIGCASHDRCDANMAMDEAWMKLFWVSPDTESSACCTLWDAAWSRAKDQGFSEKQGGPL